VHSSSSIIIDAPLENIFEVTSDLNNWPVMLPHYRYINYLDKKPAEDLVKMACWRGFLPLSWVSRHRVDPEKKQMHFEHQRAFTKGMEVVWSYQPIDKGIKVTITHDLAFRLKWLAPLAEYIIAKHFIDPVARKTLGTFKDLLEAES
jgi:uncharacterized membrane protein